MESRSELFKKDTGVKRKVSGNSHEVISYLLLPQQATAGKNFPFPYSDEAYLLNATCLQEFRHGPAPEKTLIYKERKFKNTLKNEYTTK